jgi:hypothetical protein
MAPAVATATAARMMDISVSFVDDCPFIGHISTVGRSS